MKKILIIQLLILSSLMAEQGFAQAFGKNKSNACEAAKNKARKSYKVFQMNKGCTCERIETQEWMCVLSFNYILKKK